MGLERAQHFVPFECQRELQDKQLLVDEPPPSLLKFPRARGKMDLGQRGAKGPQVVLRQVLLGKDLFELIEARLQGSARERSHVTQCKALGQRVDRQQLTLRRVVVRFDHPGVGMHHLPPRAAAACLARQQQHLAAVELFPQERLVEPHRPQMIAALPHEHAQDRATRASANSTSSTVPITLRSVFSSNCSTVRRSVRSW